MESNRIKTKREIQSFTDSELLRIVNAATGLTNKPEEFKKKFGVDCSYTFLTRELTRRGYKINWHKVADDKEINRLRQENDSLRSEVQRLKDLQTTKQIQMVRPMGQMIRRSLYIGEDTWQQWQKETELFSGKAAIADVALRHFLSHIKAGEIALTTK